MISEGARDQLSFLFTSFCTIRHLAASLLRWVEQTLVNAPIPLQISLLPFKVWWLTSDYRSRDYISMVAISKSLVHWHYTQNLFIFLSQWSSKQIKWFLWILCEEKIYSLTKYWQCQKATCVRKNKKASFSLHAFMRNFFFLNSIFIYFLEMSIGFSCPC